MNYTVKLTKDSAEVLEFPHVYLHFGHLDFATVWNKETGRHDIDRTVHTFYGSNIGEGQSFKTWQDAIHASLYDYFQYGEEFHPGDTFTVEYLGEQARFVCEGFHVLAAGR
jgi:hypothetical protein